MVKRLLTALTIGICLSFVTAQPQQVSAQVQKPYSGYLSFMKSILVIKVQSSMQTLGTKTGVPSPTPTIYAANPTATITPSKVPATPTTTKISATAFPTQKTATPTTIKLSPTVKIITPTKVPSTPTTAPATSSDPLGFMITEINAYRASQGLGPVQTSSETCNFAATRAVEISSNFSHDGFQARIDSKTLPYVKWTKVTENIAMTSNPADVVTMWKNSPGHAENMRADTPFVCVRQHGNYFAYEGMKP